VAFVSSCSGGTEPEPEPCTVTSLTILPANPSIIVGATKQMSVSMNSSNCATPPVATYATSSAGIASVSTTGLVTGVSAGTATIEASAEGATSSTIVTVNPPPVATIVISPAAPSVAEGASLSLTAILRDGNGTLLTGRIVTWNTLTPAVVSVSNDGVITGVGAGNGSVTATSEGRTATAVVTVTPPPVAQIDFDLNLWLPIGDQTTGVAVTRSAQGQILTGRPVTWSSANPAIAAVHPTSGVVSGISRGSTGITATSEGISNMRIVNVVLPFTSIAAGTDFSCGRTPISEIFCWGRNAAGSLGDGTTQDRHLATKVVSAVQFKNVVSSGSSYHTCALSNANGLYCWGLNDFGQLGIGGAGTQTTPQAINAGTMYQEVVVGGLTTCVRNNANQALCAGNNGSGQFGDGTSSFIGRAAFGPVSGGHTFLGLAMGFSHVCGRRAQAFAPNSNVMCWGRNSEGQVGTGNFANSLVPVAVTGGIQFDEIVAGTLHTCGRAGTAVYCWGDNTSGQLGDGTNQNRSSPTLVSGGLAFFRIFAGDQHTCGLANISAMYCWGNNTDGQLGDGTTLNRSVPTLKGGSVVEVAAGEKHTCFRVNNVAWCNGRNVSGQLGDGTTTGRLTGVFVR
jgi:alpha-tubulin suppressor-like RCC1 family protein/uncharacterized protein YjdB